MICNSTQCNKFFCVSSWYECTNYSCQVENGYVISSQAGNSARLWMTRSRCGFDPFLSFSLSFSLFVSLSLSSSYQSLTLSFLCLSVCLSVCLSLSLSLSLCKIHTGFPTFPKTPLFLHNCSMVLFMLEFTLTICLLIRSSRFISLQLIFFIVFFLL